MWRSKALRILGIVALSLGWACRPSGEGDIRKANVYFKNGDFKNAELHYQKAAQHKNPIAEEGLGNVYYEQKDYSRSIAHYRRAIAINARAMGARHKLAVALSTGGKHAEAIEALKEAVKLEPKNAFALYTIGGLYAKLGNLKEAEAYQVKALAADEQYHAARYALANLLVNSKRTEEAERQFTLLSQKGAKPLAEYGFAKIAASKGRYEEAADHLSVVLAGKVSHPEKILEDALFSGGWNHPKMEAVRRKLLAQVKTSSAGVKKDDVH